MENENENKNNEGIERFLSNPGKKIQVLALIFLVIGVIGSAIGAIAVMALDGGIGLLVLIAGGLGSYIGALSLYGQGKLIEAQEQAAKDLAHIKQRLAGRE